MELKRRDTILVVDDVEMNRVLLNEVFRREFEIIEAEGGIQAKELIAEENTRRNVERIAGMIIGIVIFSTILFLGVLSIIAASSRLASILRSIPPIMIYANGA